MRKANLNWSMPVTARLLKLSDEGRFAVQVAHEQAGIRRRRRLAELSGRRALETSFVRKKPAIASVRKWPFEPNSLSWRPSAVKAVSVCARMLAGALLLVLACSPKPASGPERPGQPVSIERLDNGLGIVLVPNRSAPMICSTVIVKAGAAYEAPHESGLSHMLEHLLFNGTERRTQKEIYDEVDYYGGYNNATTRRDHTLFQMLMPAQHIAHGLDVQADMLFNSVIPSDKLEKERGIVIEEIGKDEDDPGYAAENFFYGVFYGDSPAGMPILGSRKTVSAVSRETIVDYYHRHYRPDNMVALLMGDFDGAEMMALLERFFGSAPVGDSQVGSPVGDGSNAGSLPGGDSRTGSPKAGGSPDRGSEDGPVKEKGTQQEAGEAGGWSEAVGLQSGLRSSARDLPWQPYELYTTHLDADRNYIYLGWPVAGWESDRVAAFTLLEWLLNSGPSSGLDVVLKGRGRHLAHMTGASYTPYSHGGLFYVWAQSAPDVAPEEVLTAVTGLLAQLVGPGPDAEEMRGAYVSTATEEIYQSERIHHYSMLKAPTLAAISPDEFARQLKNPARASALEVSKAARDLLLELPFVMCAAGPSLEDGRSRIEYSPPEVEDAPEADVTPAPELEPSSAGIPLASTYETVRKEIPGGPVVIVRQSPDSRVFAVHVLVRDRSAMEPPGKEGIADMLHRLLTAGTKNRDRGALERELNAIGAQVKATDNPYIPFDDYYFVPDYSYLRFDTIDIFYREGLQLLAEMVAEPCLEEAEIERVRREMLAAAAKAEGSTRSSAQGLFYNALLEGTPLSKPPQGLRESIASITRDELVSFHSEYMDPSNLIVSVDCNVYADSVLAQMNRLLSWSKTERPSGAPRKSSRTFELPPTEGRKLTEELGKGQSYIYMGFTFQPREEDEAALAVMAQILSDRMAFDIREKQGLAYSVGASLALRPQGAWLTASMGTRPDNVEAAKDAMLGAFRQMAQAEVSEDEVERTRNSMLGRHLMRTLFSMGRAYYAGLGEFFGEGRQGWGLLERAKHVKPADVERVASDYILVDEVLVVIVR